MTPQQLFTWRREARRKAEQSGLGETLVPVVVETAQPSTTRPHSIELDVDGASVFIWPGAEPRMVTAIIGALKAIK